MQSTDCTSDTHELVAGLSWCHRRLTKKKVLMYVKFVKVECPPIGMMWYDEAHFRLNGYVNKRNCRIWSEANPQVYVETPLHPEKLTVWCALWAGGILLQKR
ncbi:hypothetical protein TNCV_3560531 [Trichonephila clavipes]|uniref:Uncharacterized protein n=1 Tax=Trichonephila clavipes TaxID=2585209 RepID=A0A8X6WD22_TRICX|nr:hypothetical protein TNCV_3560531 [Trichonephila clavipes]